MMSVIIQQVSL